MMSDNVLDLEFPQYEKQCAECVVQLSAQQANFARAYVSNGGVGYLAAEAAGYSKNNSKAAASRLLGFPTIAQYVKLLQSRMSTRLQIGGENVIESLIEIREMAMGRVAIREDRIIKCKDANGDESYKVVPIERIKMDLNAAIRTNELIGKSLALFIDRQQVDHTDNETIEKYLERIEEDTKKLTNRKDDIDIKEVTYKDKD